MATKAQRFKAEMQRNAHAKHPPRPARDPAGKRAAERGRFKERLPNPTSHNEAPTASKNSAYELEPSSTPRPPRKSTRRSPTHLKTDAALRITVMNRNASPKARARRSSGNPI
jgi:hypothetical protein